MHTPRVFLHTATLPREIAEIDWPVCSAGAAGTGSLSGSVSEVSRARCHLSLRLFDGGTGLLELGDELRVVKDAARDLRAVDGGRQREGSSAALSHEPQRIESV